VFLIGSENLKFDTPADRCQKRVAPRSFPDIANDIRKPGVDEHGYPRTPLKERPSPMRYAPFRCLGPM
jgi:carboxylesterase